MPIKSHKENNNYFFLLPAVEFDASHYHGDDGLGDVTGIPNPDLSLVQKENAASYLVRISQEFPGKITLLAIGPLTNLALACRIDPNFGKNFKKLVIMGGNYEGKGNITICSEFNFHFDPEAALVVLAEFTCPIVLTTWELCLKYGMSHQFLKECFQQGTARSKFVEKITTRTRQLHLDQIRGMPMDNIPCDEFAAAIMLCPDMVLNQVNVFASVEVQGLYTRGQMVIDWRNILNKRKNVFIVTKIDDEKYKKMYKNAML